MHFTSLVPRPSIVQFLMAYSMQRGGGRPGPFYHMNDVLSTKVDREEGVPHSRNTFRAHVLHFQTGAIRFFALQMFKTPALGAESTKKVLQLIF